MVCEVLGIVFGVTFRKGDFLKPQFFLNLLFMLFGSMVLGVLPFGAEHAHATQLLAINLSVY